MNPFTDKIVAYRIPDEGAEERYGLCIRRESDMLRVMVMQREDNREVPLQSVLRKLADEDAIMKSLEERLNSLQAKLAKEGNTGGQSSNYRLQETMLQWATRRLEGVDAEEWRRLAQERHPSAVVKAVGCAAASIATDAKLVSSAWTDAQSLFSKGRELTAELRCAGEHRMSKALYNSLVGYISDSSLSYALVAQASPSLSMLHKWITALVDYQRARYMEDGEAEQQQQLIRYENSLRAARGRRGSLMEQADLINGGNCYIRTQAVRSVPMDCVLHPMAAEKVTTRQYLLKEPAPMEMLDDVMRRPLTSVRSARSSRQEDSFPRRDVLSARSVDAPGLRGNRTNAGVKVPPISIPKVESAGAGMWSGGGVVRSQRSLEKEGNGNGAVSKVNPPHVGTRAATEAADRGVNGVHPDGAASPSSSPSSSSTAPSPRPLSMRVEVKQLDEPDSSQRRMLSARHGGTEPMQVLTDVRNNFRSVQAVLLACLEDYQKLEDKYASTVEHSKQLLHTLESRDHVIAHLQQELTAVTGVQAASKTMPVQPRDGCGSDAVRHRNLDELFNSGLATPHAVNAESFGDEDSFERHFEQLLYDTLEFLQGAESTPSTYEDESNRG
ncbi:hypothetical protein ABB37_03417 [Leptomonas pyrrhocoris]|uniref:Uncharacterized protein n=1 Tax=Leptomonas pyrrhocoris TaxID=157538 RepID=A0A0N0DX24_LEPPY|nr:hypothetical protein ABB37_03417 [Leptomonas pyrrhocoris]XP_015660762.1 hypothetical protein ABB37_03417 [Leptomonas pyrrhocoris]KPA82322.1 hypothetical protein ABB37_03417 [Leptomonas pyrrhocoris]KPA82323.1 hypothetical protein ABB37_03417 [Leptomonas pyrrhocoris]|eukprot:XP_015660761.1 hypothetical protein ABB37_03417 [Leptomonas pyrrhocoris]